MRPVLTAAMVTTALWAMPTCAVAASPGPGHAGPAPLVERVRVGEPPGETGPGHPRALALPATRTLDCERARLLGDRLGETYTGFRLRASLLDRACPPDIADAARRAVWPWPWAHDRIDATAPPQLALFAGAWQVRCARNGPRRRCALIGQGRSGAGSHFVLDRIAGAEGLIWRVHLRREVKPEAATPGEGNAAEAVPGTGLTIDTGAGVQRQAFTACDRGVCMFEATLAQAADVAGVLEAGRDVRLGFTGAAGGMVLQAAGFRDGLRELVRLRRAE